MAVKKPAAKKPAVKNQSARKKGLGRGLTALLGNSDVEAMIAPQNDNELRNIDVDLIERGPWQPREHFDEDTLQELADSIAQQGVVQPIVVREKAGGRFEIVAGERRWRASQRAGLSQVPAVIKTFDDQTAAAVSLIENIQRENLNPLEESTALKRLIDEFKMTHQQVADTVARSRATVSNLLRLQDLNPDVKALLAMRDIEMGHARALLAIDGMEQSQVAKEVAKKGLSVRVTEALIRKISQPPKKANVTKKDPDIIKLEERLTERLGAPVNIKQKTNGRGSLEISYSSLDVLEGILNKIES
ncbi:MAG: ParB/RepB/Spo0J family partition protein [Proteobacteria bacterium]|nr:ParB/RepB/Spo0J family partition protein [Pseudomonadota bacterium]